MTLNFVSTFEKENIRGRIETKEALIVKKPVTVFLSLRYLCGYYRGD